MYATSLARCVYTLFQPLDGAQRELIREALNARPDLNQSRLAELVEVDASTISRILGKGRSARVTTLEAIARVLGIDREELVDQGELELQIDDAFMKAAHKALSEQLRHLQRQVGRISVQRVSGVVGVHLHGRPPEKRVFEREFTLSLRRRAQSLLKKAESPSV